MASTPPSIPALSRLRQTLAGFDPTLAPHLAEPGRTVPLSLSAIDRVLGGGLAIGALHELAPERPVHLGAACGFATALAALAGRECGKTLWIATEFAGMEAGELYAPGLEAFGLAAQRLLLLRVLRPTDALWAMEEALRCRGLAAVVAELTGEGAAADLTATRRLALAAREAAGFGLLLRHTATAMPAAAATRWRIAAAPSAPDAFGGLGCAAFILSLVRNRRGPCGRWLVNWDRHAYAFHAAVSLGVAETALDRPARTPARRAG